MLMLPVYSDATGVNNVVTRSDCGVCLQLFPNDPILNALRESSVATPYKELQRIHQILDGRPGAQFRIGCFEPFDSILASTTARWPVSDGIKGIVMVLVVMGMRHDMVSAFRDSR